MKHAKSLVVILLLLASTLARSQAIRDFTPDPEKFPVELSLLFERITNKDNKEAALATHENFKILWESGAFDTVQQNSIYTLANLMLDRRVKSYPYFAVMLQSLASMKNQGYPNDQINIWITGAIQSLENSRSQKDFVSFMNFSASLFENNALYEARLFKWYTTGRTNFHFNSDSVFKVIFETTNLICTNLRDSSVIYNTAGTYYPLELTWQGKSGKITWERAGLDPDMVYARFGNFEVSLKSSPYSIDNVNFYHHKYLSEPLTGKLVEKLSTDVVEPRNASYPYFQSSVRDLFIGGLFQDVDYNGGFAMKGANILGEGDEYRVAKLIFKRPYRDKQGKYDLLVARSNAFIIKPDGINASNAQVTIHHQDDSVFHAGLQFKYMNDRREVSLLRVEKGISESPYFNTFHNVDVDVEAVYWKMDEPNIRFRSMMGIQPNSEALFISDKYFIEREYDILQGLDYTHPLIVINNYAKKYNTERFYAYQLARFMNMPENQVELQLIRLAKYGFLFYNTDTKQAIINDKLYHYIAAKAGRQDYDVISFFSRVENQDNATLSLDNFDLKIRGVPQVFISDSQNVYIRPTNGEVTLRKNRDFLFSGNIEAGLFQFKTTGAYFEYDTFKINLPVVEEMRFKVKAFDDEPGELNFVDVKTVISDISGEILIDFPSNKNGLGDYPEYPIFSSTGQSFVYYNQDSIHNNAYNPEVFNYNVQPFTIKRLSDFSNKDLEFNGFLNSAGIFPPEASSKLKVMPDYSLGFKIKSSPQGYPIYGGTGTFYDSVSLSNKGLRGTGRLDYLNTSATGRNLVFYPDSAIGKFDVFTIKKSTNGNAGFPAVEGKNLTQRWFPYKDTLLLSSTDSLISMFDNRARLKGNLTFTPEVLTGGGRLDFYTARTFSDDYIFGDNYFRSDSLRLAIRDFNEQEIAFSADRFSANVNFDQQTGSFNSISDSSKIGFPLNRFEAGLDNFDWYISRNEIKLRSNKVNSTTDPTGLSLRKLMDVTPNGAKFLSLHPLHDSLSFYSTEASFNLADTTLVAEDVKYVKVADVAVFPGDGRVEIREKGKIQPLENAMIIADTADKTHLITDARVNIESKYSYKASGTYAYKNLVDDIQVINFDNIEVDTSYQTVAEGKIPEEQQFMFSPQFTFMGDVSLNAGNPLLNFDGSFQIVQDCDPALSRWVNFSGRTKPDSLIFPVPKQPKEYGGRKLYAGIFHSNENNRVYPVFLSPRTYFSDTLMTTADGILTTRKKGTEFLITSEGFSAIPDNEFPDAPFIALNTNDCKITTGGPVSFATDFNKVKMEAFGNVTHYIIPDSTLFNVFITLDFFFNEEALSFMAQSLKNTNVKGADVSGPVQQIAYREMLGREGAAEYLFELNSVGRSRDLPERLNRELVISDVTLKYYPETRSFISQGPISIGMIGGEPVNKQLDGYLEIVRKRSGDIFTLYLEVDRRHWYFFSHMGNLMQTISSKNEYNRYITDTDAGDRKQKAEKNETEYRYIISTNAKKNRFLRSIRELIPGENEEE
jgi:hypothetical protein